MLKIFYGKPFLFAVLFVSVLSCTGNTVTETVSITGDTLRLRYSSLLQIMECDSFCIVEIKDPWRKDAFLQRYALIPEDVAVTDVPHELTRLNVPMKNLLVFSTLHAQLLQTFGKSDAISGVCDARYMSVPVIHEKLSSGEIVDCGSSMDVDMERLMELAPEAAWVIPFKNGGYGKLERMDFPLVECVDYMETSPLGCAEWIRFYGRLLGVTDFADSLFNEICERYDSIKSVASRCAYKPKLLCELKNGAAWYVPGGSSTMGQLYCDAGADYLFADNGQSGSVPLSFETVLSHAGDADIWLVKYGADRDKTYFSLEQEFSGYSLLKPFRDRNIYACNVSRKRFYEETPFRPDILLEELVMLLHPELNGGYEFKYYEKLQEK